MKGRILECPARWSHQQRYSHIVAGMTGGRTRLGWKRRSRSHMFANGAQHSTPTAPTRPRQGGRGVADIIMGVQVISWVTEGWLGDSLAPTFFPEVLTRKASHGGLCSCGIPTFSSASILPQSAANTSALTCGPKCPEFTSPIAHPSHDTGYVQS